MMVQVVVVEQVPPTQAMLQQSTARVQGSPATTQPPATHSMPPPGTAAQLPEQHSAEATQASPMPKQSPVDPTHVFCSHLPEQQSPSALQV
jgi:hypothetical protein